MTDELREAREWLAWWDAGGHSDPDYGATEAVEYLRAALAATPETPTLDRVPCREPGDTEAMADEESREVGWWRLGWNAAVYALGERETPTLDVERLAQSFDAAAERARLSQP